MELILSNAGKLRGSRFGINRDYPQEIVDARKSLFQEKRLLKSQHPTAKFSIQYPAKLTMNGNVIKDMFPDWFSVMKGHRLNTDGYIRPDNSSGYGHVFDTSDISVMEESDIERDCGSPVPQQRVHQDTALTPNRQIEDVGAGPSRVSQDNLSGQGEQPDHGLQPLVDPESEPNTTSGKPPKSNEA